MRTRTLLAACAIYAISHGAQAQIFGLSDAITQLFGGRSEFCSKLLSNRISALDPTQKKNCSEVSASDLECQSRCQKIDAEDSAIAAKAKAFAEAKVNSIGEGFERGISTLSKDKLCGNKYNRPRELTEDECNEAFALGEINARNEAVRRAEAEQRHAKNLLDKAEAEKQKQDELRKFYSSNEFQRLRNSIAVLTQQAKIELAENEQKRQREIAAQSGVVNQSAIHRFGAQIVDARNEQRAALLNYKKHGGTANEVEGIRKRVASCQLSQETLSAMFILAATGHLSEPASDQVKTWAAEGSCM